MPNPEEFYPSNIIFQKLNENKWIAYDNNLGFPEFTGPSKKEVYNKIKEYKNGLNDSFLEGKVKSNNSLEYANLQIELSRTDTILDFGITFYLEFTEAGKIEFSVSF